MSDLLDLPLFTGLPVAEPPPAPKRRPKVKPAPPPTQAGSRVVVLSLARDRRLIANLVARYEASPCDPHRATSFRRRILMPLVAKRIAIGLAPDQQEIELDRIEQAMVNLILAQQDRDGPGGRAA